MIITFRHTTHIHTFTLLETCTKNNGSYIIHQNFICARSELIEMDNQHKIRPFTCYFCNKLIDNDTEYGHVSNCGSVLEPCINKCGSYVPRNMKARHMKECKNRKISKSMSKLSVDDSYDYHNSENVQILHNPNAGVLAATLPHTRVKPKPDLYQLPPNSYGPNLTEILNRFQNLDQTCKQMSHNMLILKNKHQEAVQTNRNAHMQAQMQFEKLQYQNQIMTEWKRTIEMQIENLKQEMKFYQKFQNDAEGRLSSIQSMQDVEDKIQLDLKVMQKQFHEEQLVNREAFNDLQGNLNEFKDYFTQENAVVAALWNDYKVDTEKLAQEILTINKTLHDNKTKQSSLIFDLRTVSQISAETSDKCEIQERVLAEIKKDLSQFKLDLQSLEESSTNELAGQGTCSTPGRLLWKVSNFSAKMENARENDTIIKSPIFYTHDYGYKVRLQIYLNGIKKWKGRHMIACLHVLKGEYDLLLKWPCYIEGTIILRDLYNFSNPNDFSKYISAKRYSGDEENEEPQESSTQYIFVPHTTLTKQNFIKEDTMFIEIRINSISKLRDETEL